MQRHLSHASIYKWCIAVRASSKQYNFTIIKCLLLENRYISKDRNLIRLNRLYELQMPSKQHQKKYHFPNNFPCTACLIWGLLISWRIIVLNKLYQIKIDLFWSLSHRSWIQNKQSKSKFAINCSEAAVSPQQKDQGCQGNVFVLVAHSSSPQSSPHLINYSSFL